MIGLCCLATMSSLQLVAIGTGDHVKYAKIYYQEDLVCVDFVRRLGTNQ